jgi:hypothetical protein
VKQRLVAGGEIDALSVDEARALFDELAGKLATRTVRPAKDGRTDAAGALTLSVYTVPIGMELEVNRLLVTADGFTPAAPYLNAAGYLYVLRAGVVVDFLSLATGGLPALSTDGTGPAVRYRNGEDVGIALVSGPASTKVQAAIQGRLFPSAPS